MKYLAKILWQKKETESFIDNKYSRNHIWHFDGGTKVNASSSSQVISVPMSDDTAVDPEEAFVAAASSCHMLWFLHLAGKQNYIVERYEDNAVGSMTKNENGKMAITHIDLFPKVSFESSNVPTHTQLIDLHDLAHKDCYIANSVKASFKINISK